MLSYVGYLYGLCSKFTPYVCAEAYNAKIVPKIHVRFVTRGTNPATIIESANDMEKVITDPSLAARALWKLEVVTDKEMDLHSIPIMNQCVVPDSYQTPNNTKFKGRALDYAARTIHCDDDAWILHMDEESYFDVENGHKIADWCLQEDYNIKHRGMRPIFANGLIVYTKTQPENWILNVADSIRVGDDLGKYRLIGEFANFPVFGVHGSFLMIHAEIENKIGFDVGYENSITEDFAQALRSTTAGYRFGFIRAVVEEQSPFNLSDFWKQRVRWQKGIIMNAIYSDQVSRLCQLSAGYIGVGYCLPAIAMIKFIPEMLLIYYWGEDKAGYWFVPFGYTVADDVLQFLLVLIIVTPWFMYMIGYIFGGYYRLGRARFFGGLLFLAVGGCWLLYVCCETVAMMMYWVGGNYTQVEFHIVNKDRTDNKYNKNVKDANAKRSDKDYKKLLNEEVDIQG